MIDRRRAFQILRAAKIHEPGIVKFSGYIHIFEGFTHIAKGRTIEEALEGGGFLPVPDGVVIPYTTNGCNVRKGGDHIAMAKSRNTALRIANALNAYTPGRAGY